MHRVKEQLEESKYLLMTLKSEVAIYDKIATMREHGSGMQILQDEASKKNLTINVSDLLDEIRCLSEQLQQGFDSSNILREKLSQKLTESDIDTTWKERYSKAEKGLFLPDVSKHAWESSEGNKLTNDRDLSNKAIRFVIKTEHLETLKTTITECRKGLENKLARWDSQQKVGVNKDII